MCEEGENTREREREIIFKDSEVEKYKEEFTEKIQ